MKTYSKWSSESLLRIAFIVFPNNVHKIVACDQSAVCLFVPLLFLPLLVMEVRRIQQLRRKDGACGLHPFCDIPEESLRVVIDEGDGCSGLT